jgi:hypothetical protein
MIEGLARPLFLAGAPRDPGDGLGFLGLDGRNAMADFSLALNHDDGA